MATELTRAAPEIGSSSYVEWGAVLAGSVAAVAVSFVLLNFGAAIGFASVSPWTSTATGLKAVGVGAAFWMLLVTLWSFALGGYLAGRLRHRWYDGTKSEVEFRDSAHGLLVWAVTVIFAAMLAAAGVAGVGKGLGAAAVSSATSRNTMATTADLLLRSDKLAQPGQLEDMRSEISRILVTSAREGEVTTADRAYLSQLVTARTGLSPAEAEKRVSDTLDQMKAGLDRARKLAIILGFLTASILLIGGAVAWWAAARGGARRDDGTVWHSFAIIKAF
jgi:hypothetical protein